MAKKIGAIVSLSIIGILILATIIMANVNVDYSINCATPTTVWVKKQGSSTEVLAKDKTNDIIEFINGASKEKSLTALFNGTLGKKAEVEYVGSSSGKTIPTSASYYVRYSYNNAQKLMVGKKAYKDANNNEVYYEDLVFEVNNVEGTALVNVYVVLDSTNSNNYSYCYKLEADFESLYDYLQQNFSY